VSVPGWSSGNIFFGHRAQVCMIAWSGIMKDWIQPCGSAVLLLWSIHHRFVNATGVVAGIA
jgi:hypothetical protein